MPEIFSARFVENKIGTTKKLRENQHLAPAANFRENSENKQIFPISQILQDVRPLKQHVSRRYNPWNRKITEKSVAKQKTNRKTKSPKIADRRKIRKIREIFFFSKFRPPVKIGNLCNLMIIFEGFLVKISAKNRNGAQK